MADKSTEIGSKSQGTNRVIGKVAGSKGEVWRVASDGKIRNIITSNSTSHVMDEAVKIYGRALRRLADR